jgi:hypothetical protein
MEGSAAIGRDVACNVSTVHCAEYLCRRLDPVNDQIGRLETGIDCVDR